MKKNLVGVIVAVVLMSGYGAVATSFTDQNIVEKTDIFSLSSVQLIEEQDYTRAYLFEATSYMSMPDSYRLPVVTRVYRFPFLTKISNIDVSFSEAQERVLSKPLQLAPRAILDNAQQQTRDSAQSVVWSICPEQPYSYHIAAGREGDALTTFLAIHLYPVQYLPLENILRFSENVHITITYELPHTPLPVTTDQYELLIIAPKTFSQELEPLVTHKVSKGMTTKLVSTQDIYTSVYFPVEGRDCAEKMKYFIKNAFDNWDIKYVLLVGGRSGGVKQEKWWVPVRYSNLNDNNEGSFLTDLYFADLYDSNGSFSSWDSDDNGIFAEWNSQRQDILDMYPEVYVGRLPCTNSLQVKTMVKKIIAYETLSYGSEWFKTFVGVAGDTYPSPNDPYYEGELATNASFQQLESLGFTASMLWTSNGRFTDPESVITEISKGCGFVHFSGHGNPMVWANHPPRNTSWIDGPNAFQMRKLSNGNKQPIVIVGGCHNAQFNTSIFNMVRGILEDGVSYFSSKQPYGEFWHYEWIPRVWAWSLASQSKGGAIAVIANTGYGYGEQGENTLINRGRHMEWLFFKAYQDGMINLGETHSTDIIYYMNEHPPMQDLIDCKIAQQWALLGDPSLLIGGYPS